MSDIMQFDVNSKIDLKNEVKMTVTTRTQSNPPPKILFFEYKRIKNIKRGIQMDNKGYIGKVFCGCFHHFCFKTLSLLQSNYLIAS